MLTCIAVILPGILAAFLNSRRDDGNAENPRIFLFDKRKLIVRSFLYIVLINFFIYCGMWIIGMRQFDFFGMSARFKIKWFLLGVGLAAVSVGLGNIPKLKRKGCIGRIKQVSPVALVFTVTYAVFAPSSLFLNNINEFRISYFKVAPIILLMAAALWLCLTLISLCIREEKNVIYYLALLFGLTLGVYLQTNFLNPQLPELDGTPVEWSVYGRENVLSILCWALCIVLPVLLTFFMRKLVEKAVPFLSWFLSAVQMVSLVVLIISNPLDDSVNYGFSKEDEFTLGAEENIVIFIVDTLQADAMEEYLESGACPAGNLDGFTFFTNAVGGGAPTHFAMPTLLTGSEYDPLQSFPAYYRDAWEDTALYDDMHRNGYDVRFYSSAESLYGISEREADNYAVLSEGVWIENPAAFGEQLYKLANFYAMPQFLKKQFWLSTEIMTDLVKQSAESYQFYDNIFYRELQEAGDLPLAYDKAFRLYHFRGVHEPYIIDENVQLLTDSQTTEQKTLQGNMKEICLYLDMMKRAGVYDSSTIIIAGDHGRHAPGNLEANPAVLIKRPQETHEPAYSAAPIHFRNIVPVMAMTMMEDYSAYGPSAYDITEESDVERLHTIDDSIRKRNTADDAWGGREGYACRFIVPDDPVATEEFRIWNPYEINRISCKPGEKIDFTGAEGAAPIGYRLYQEDTAAIASNELSVCFELADYGKADMTFHFTYDRIYNGSQTIRIYADGQRVGTLICTANGAGNDCSVVIPKDLASDGEVAIRMVFPNAVTPNQLDRANPDTRVLSVALTSMWIE